MKFISIGRNCQVAYQIRRHFKNDESYFFDWLISDIKSVEKVLCDFKDSYFLSDIEVCANGIRVFDQYTGVQIQHDFPVNQSGLIESSLIEDTELINKIKSKFLYLRHKLISVLEDTDDDKVVLVWFDWANHGDFICKKASETLNKIISGFANKDNILYLIISTELKEDKFFDEGAMIKIEPYKNNIEAQYKWRGDDESWSQAFEKFELKYDKLDF